MSKPGEVQSPIAPEIVGFYNDYQEAQRLKGVVGQLERLRTQELVERYLPPAASGCVRRGRWRWHLRFLASRERVRGSPHRCRTTSCGAGS